MKCVVAKCKQYSHRADNKPYVSFYKFPKNEAERKQWVKFCNRVKPINANVERMCSLHFKQDDFVRNLQFELGFSTRRTLKLKPGAVPSIHSPAESEDVIEVVEEESTQHIIDLETATMTEMEDEMHIKTLETQIAALRQENGKLKASQSESHKTIKYLSCQVQKLTYENVNLDKAMKHLFTQGQMKKLKNCIKRQQYKTALSGQSSSAKAHRLLRKKHSPLPSVRNLQR